jgi:tetratricopeptide (TPR) repeat protein
MNNIQASSLPFKNQQQAFLEQQIVRAMQMLQQNELDESDRVIGSVLKIQPKNAQALFCKGLIAYNRGLFQDSEKCFTKAIQIQKSPSFYNNRGSAYFALKKMVEAEADYRQALKIEPNFLDAILNLANLYALNQRMLEAVTLYDELLEKDPHHIDALFNRANTHKKLKNFEQALKDFERVTKLDPKHARAYLNQGNTFLAIEQLDEAIDSYGHAVAIIPNYFEALNARANAYFLTNKLELAMEGFKNMITLRPDNKEAYFGLGNCFNEKYLYEEGLVCFQKAVEIDPQYFDALTNLANNLRRLKRFDEAATYYGQAVLVNPESPDAYSNLGNILHDLKRTDLAIDSYAKAVELEPNNTRANYNLGNIFKELNQFEAALKQFDHVLQLSPNDVETEFARGMILLTQGNYLDGFRLYEKRWERSSASSPAKLREYPQPMWTGKESLENKTILIYIEQGLGDSIQFCRFIPQLASMGAKVVFEVQEPLLGMMQQVKGIDQLIPYKAKYDAFDYFCPLLSLPAALGVELEKLPMSEGYLKADKNYIEKWSARLGAKTKPRVGLICSGNPRHENDQNRSILLFEIFPYLPSDFEYITLQKEMRPVDREMITKYPLIQSFGDELESFDDTAALCELMDIVISVDTSVAHLTGAMGKKTWLLVPYCPDWRWLVDRKDSPWYQSMTIYRQESMKDWRSTFGRVAEDLKQELLIQ